jgi:hypothetical protein
VNPCDTDICQTTNPLQQICRIRPKDFDLSGCGVPLTPAPSAARYLDLYKAYVYSVVLGAAGSGTDILFDERKSVDSNADFYLHQITPITGNYFGRFQWPSGRFSSQALQDIKTFRGVMMTKNPDGSTRYIRIPAGQFIGIALQNFTNQSVNVTILFEGCKRFYIK